MIRPGTRRSPSEGITTTGEANLLWGVTRGRGDVLRREYGMCPPLGAKTGRWPLNCGRVGSHMARNLGARAALHVAGSSRRETHRTALPPGRSHVATFHL